MGKAIVITSGKGGVGKTTTTANLGTALALMGKKVCLVDLDIGLRNLDVILGLDNRILYDIVDVVAGRAQIRQALVKDKRFDDLLFLLPAAQNADKDALNPDQVRAIVDELKPDFDYVLLDCPAGIEQGFMNAIAGADAAIIVSTPEISAIRDADRVVGAITNIVVSFLGSLNVGTNPPVINQIYRGLEENLDELVWGHLGEMRCDIECFSHLLCNVDRAGSAVEHAPTGRDKPRIVVGPR